MGVRWLLKWQQDVGVPGREVFEALCAAVEPLKTAERQSWKVQNASLRQGQVETPLGLRDAVGPKVEVQCITLGEADGSMYLLQREQRRVMQADQAMMDILSKVMPYKARASMRFEGWQYQMGDFTVCIGRATLKPKQEFRGFVVEIHYHPLDDLLMGQAICKEIVEILQMGATGLKGSLKQVGADYQEWSLGDTYSLQHLAVQYNALTMAVL
ncbi:g5258 [Coccomyxa viridis]|uniref:Mediator of RNA polymerase II transcription subunit 20 n=1 Tax=Coccomyxa viridis TaxID=1274662 RepID=A0ABP1FSD3_9CHLO